MLCEKFGRRQFYMRYYKSGNGNFDVNLSKKGFLTHKFWFFKNYWFSLKKKLIDKKTTILSTAKNLEHSGIQKLYHAVFINRAVGTFTLKERTGRVNWNMVGKREEKTEALQLDYAGYKNTVLIICHYFKMYQGLNLWEYQLFEVLVFSGFLVTFPQSFVSHFFDFIQLLTHSTVFFLLFLRLLLQLFQLIFQRSWLPIRFWCSLDRLLEKRGTN